MASQSGSFPSKVSQEAWRAIAAEVPVDEVEVVVEMPPAIPPAVDASLSTPPLASTQTMEASPPAPAPAFDPGMVVTPQQVFSSPRVRVPVEDMSDKAWLKQFMLAEAMPSRASVGSESFKVFSRVRPLHGWEERIGVKSCVRVWGDHQQGVEVTNNDGSKARFTLDACLDESATQEDTFHVSVCPPSQTQRR